MKKLFTTVLKVSILPIVLMNSAGCVGAGIAMMDAGEIFAPTSEDEKLKEFAIAHQRSQIYIYRDGMFPPHGEEVVVDGKFISKMYAGSFLVVTVDPGDHILESKSPENSVMMINTKANNIYFVQQEVRSFSDRRTKMNLVDDKTGKAAVIKCKLLRTKIIF